MLENIELTSARIHLLSELNALLDKKRTVPVTAMVQAIRQGRVNAILDLVYEEQIDLTPIKRQWARLHNE